MMNDEQTKADDVERLNQAQLVCAVCGGQWHNDTYCRYCYPVDEQPDMIRQVTT